MLRASVPPSFPIPFAASAGVSFIRPIPEASQIGVNAGAASLTDGFVPDNFVQIAAGGVPPFGQDMNGILNQITLWNQWQEAGGPVFFNSAFTAANGGYPQDAVLMSAVVPGKYWISTADNNNTDPDSSGAANWVSLPGIAATGEPGINLTGVLPAGWVWAKNSYTIGNASSGASFADPSAQFLFEWLWSNFPNSQCPVSGGRGANPAADFAANKTIQVLDLAGTGVIGNDNSTGRLSGVPVTSGNINSPGSIIGENEHVLSVGELAAHDHANSVNDPEHLHDYNPFQGGMELTSGIFPGGASGGHNNTAFAFTGISVSINQNGSNFPHNTVQRSMVVNWMLKL